MKLKSNKLSHSIPNSSCLIAMVFTSILLMFCLCATPANAFQATSAQTQTQASTEDWKVFTPSDARAEFKMPSKPRYVQRVFTPVKNQAAIKVHLRQAVADEGKVTYLFVYNDLNERPETKKAIDKALDGAVRGSIVNVSGELAKKVDAIKYKTHPGRQFVYRYVQGEKQFIVISRVFLVGQRLYQITFLSLESVFNETLAAKFLNSFQLVQPPSDAPPVPRIKK